MTSTLHSDPAATVLRRLLTAEEAGDPQAMADAGLESPTRFPVELDAAARAEKFQDVYMSVSATGGELLYLLARASGARTVVEYGTSYGVSTIHLAAAVRDNGGGAVITTELAERKAVAAQRNVAEAGLDDLVDLRVGDARETLAQVPEPVDLVLLDGWPDLALDVLQVVEPALRPGSLVLVDDVDMDFGHDVHGPLLQHLAEHYASLKLPISDGVQAAVRL